MKHTPLASYHTRSDSGFVDWKVVIVLVLFVVGIGLVVRQYRVHFGSADRSVSYDYWCSGCDAVFDVAELKKDYPDSWRIAPGGPDESVVICPRCDEGWAYPVRVCGTCGTAHLPYAYFFSEVPGDLMLTQTCPVCHPEIAEEAAEQGVDLMPPAIQ